MNARVAHPRVVGLLACAAALLAGCVDDEALITDPDPVPSPGGELFARYVSLGNSITAGVQGAGINAATQMQTYPVLVAEQAGADFVVPLLAEPGCPPPMAAPLGPRIAENVTCAFRENVTRIPQNLAVPTERIADLLEIPMTSVGQINTLLLGPRTQTEAMIAADPSLVSLWIGNNDALAAALSGRLGPSSAGGDSVLTPLAAFQASLSQVVDAIHAADPRDAVLIGVVDAIRVAPLIQPGAYFFALYSQNPTAFGGKRVSANCAPRTPTGQPNPLAANLVSFQIVSAGDFPVISCDPDEYPEGDPRRGLYLLDRSEQQVVGARVAAFNAAIEAAAEENGWIYIDPNLLVLPYLADGPPFDYDRKCQMLASATTPAHFQQAVVQSCPVPPELGGAPNFFGSLISFDGVHPSSLAHRIVANAMIDAVNAKHDLAIPTLPVS